ncbi:hypothetical protein EBT31_08120 [bacterium]|nr:hypothetical protein [bacterium]
MSALNHSLLLTQEDSAYRIQRSLRFDGGGVLSRTLGTATSRFTCTFSTWVKRSALGGNHHPIFCYTGSLDGIYFSNADNLVVRDGGGTATTYTSTTRYTDTTAWYHIVVAVNGTTMNAYVNNELVLNSTSFAQFTYINSTTLHGIGYSSSSYLSGYLADTHFIDGQILTPSSFGAYDANNEWQPIQYVGTYGNNGFRLNYSDNSDITSTTLGADSSGRANHWTPSGFSVAAGVGNDSLVDTPTSYGVDTGVGGQVCGNYATFNPLDATVTSVSNGALDYSATTAATGITGTIGMKSSKWYWEVQTSGGTTQTEVGVISAVNRAASARFALPADLTVYGFRFDADAGTLDRTTNGTTWASIATGLTSGPYLPYFYNSGTTAKTVSVNFGQRPFTYTAPSGYKVLCDTTMPALPITVATTVMSKVLYTGTGVARTVTSSLGFSPDFLWIKNRSTAVDHALYDTARGVTVELCTSLASAETTQAQGVTAFNSNGFNVGTLNKVNAASANFAAYCWDAGSSSASNTSGTISSTVRANVSAGFSIVTYTGNGVAGATIGHGLGVAPTWIMIKARTAANPWNIYTTVLDGSLDYFSFSTAAKLDSSEALPTSSVFSVSSGVNVNGNGTSYIAYCWTPVPGISQSFTYTGNNTNPGPFVYLGFQPTFILIKQATAASATDWALYGGGANPGSQLTYPNLTAIEATTINTDATANGFRIRAANNAINAPSGSYVGYAWSAVPFQIGRAR